jgi:two-component system cell cycle response regulator
MSARILVVDDTLPNVKLLQAKLEAEYYEVITATSGEEALQKMYDDIPDIVLLDIMMPGMDGFEVCTRIKDDARISHIPVIMVTALSESEDRVRGLECGADDFLSKPINDTALMARVRSLVRLKMTVDEWRARENTANQLGVGGDANIMDEPVEKANVLVIEDQEFESGKIESALSRDEDSVTVVEKGPDALATIRETVPDLIVISLNLEAEDGLRLASHLRTNERTRSVPILMIAGEDNMERIAHGLEIGVHDYIVRPVDRNELLARVRSQIRRKRYQQRLRENYEMSLSMALTDSLTGLYNRRYFETHLQKLLAKNAENRKSMAIVYLDIDHFKHVNDTYGHGVGDEILKIFANRLVDKLRSFDLVARLGGEEFVAILPEVQAETAHYIAERLRRAISDHAFTCSVPEGELEVTSSLGGVVIEAGEDNMAEVLERADAQLYNAKEDGRNCIYFEGVGRLDSDSITIEERKNA